MSWVKDYATYRDRMERRAMLQRRTFSPFRSEKDLEKDVARDLRPFLKRERKCTRHARYVFRSVVRTRVEPAVARSEAALEQYMRNPSRFMQLRAERASQEAAREAHGAVRAQEHAFRICMRAFLPKSLEGLETRRSSPHPIRRVQAARG